MLLMASYICLLFLTIAQTTGEKILTTDIDDEETYEDFTAAVKFWICKVQEWPSKLESFQKSVSDLTNQYCQSEPAECCLSAWNNNSVFPPTAVRILPNYPVVERFTFIHVKFVILYNTDLHMNRQRFDLSQPSCQKLFVRTPYALVSEVLEDIVRNGLNNISTAVGWPIIATREPSSFERFINVALVPLGTVSCLILLLTVYVLKRWRERKDEVNYKDRHLRNKIGRRRKKLFRQFDSLNSPRTQSTEPLTHDTAAGSLALPVIKSHSTSTTPLSELSVGHHTLINVEPKEPVVMTKML